jgi:pimeloyl-ACP methyl ester carboxylesterase
MDFRLPSRELVFLRKVNRERAAPVRAPRAANATAFSAALLLYSLLSIFIFFISRSSSAYAQASGKKPAPTPAGGGLSATTSSAAPKGVVPGEVQDFRVVTDQPDDPFEFERLGIAAVNAKELGRARTFFERSWKLGELPTSAYNLACVDAKEGKLDSAFQWLDKAIAAGFDDENPLKSDPDVAPLRDKPKFRTILAGAQRNRTAGDAAVVRDGVFLAPKGKPAAILVLVHDKASDPFRVSGPFAQQALDRGFYVAVPRGPSLSAKKRFGWGSADRAAAAIDAAVSAAKKKVGNVPVLLVGVERGGTIAFTTASRRPGVFAGVGSIGGNFDAGEVAGNVAGLRGARLFFGIPRDAPQNLVVAFRRGIESLRAAGYAPAIVEWPGYGTGFPKDVAGAVKDTLDALAGRAAS